MTEETTNRQRVSKMSGYKFFCDWLAYKGFVLVDKNGYRYTPGEARGTFVLDRFKINSHQEYAEIEGSSLKLDGDRYVARGQHG